MLIFLEEQQQFILAEMAEYNMDILGKCVANMSADKARLVLKQRRNMEKKKKSTDDQEHALLVELSRELLVQASSYYLQVSSSLIFKCCR